MSENEDVIPSIRFNPNTGLIRIEGRSAMRDVQDFYLPFIEQIKNTTVPTFIVEIKLEHFDTGTMKCLYQMMLELKEKQAMGALLMVRWFSEEGDDDHKEQGEDLESKSGIPFQYKTY
ncbi:SiaC family regulatory phosphoprotein [Ekhidna sp.]|uniref:SiaC family regulatory phosphoprotein n=1 Tax=Ekhidna sp. TaxID=2608089 RepID=UPI003298DE24